MTVVHLAQRAGRALTGVLALVAVLGTVSTAHAASPPVQFGVGGWSFPTPNTLAYMHKAGLRTWRLTMSWRDVSPTSPAENFSGYDNVLRAAAAQHIQMLITLTGCPTWACPQGGPPVSPTALGGFRQFVRDAVRRYGHQGVIWGPHPAFPVVYWQVFNEVNGADQWPNPSAASYAAVLRATASTIHHADPKAKVVLAGLGEKMTIWLRDYLPALYRQPGFKRSIDVMAVEGYSVHAHDPGHILTKTRKIMRRFHDTNTPVFVTEMGWSTGGPPFPFTTSPAGQAALLSKSWSQLQACRARWRLRRVYWFSWGDMATTPSNDYWGYHNGLVDLSGAAKPSFYEFERFLRPATAARNVRCHL